jgi:hypothetical protein
MKRPSTILAVLCFATFVLAVPRAFGQKLDGTWKASLTVGGQRCIDNLVMGPGQHYSEVLRCGSLMTRQAGTYDFTNGVLTRNVTDWDPKQRYVLDSGYSGHWEPNAKPPGGSYRIKFTSADTMVWQDINLGGIVTFRRSQ